MKKTLITLATLLSFNVAATEINIVEKAKQNTTYVKTDKGAGTGFFIENTKLMITNKHVANQKSKYIGIMDSNGNKYWGMFVFDSLDYDLALIKVFDKKDNLIVNNTDLRVDGGLKLCEHSNIAINEEIFGFGSPAGQRHVFRKGYINSPKSFNQHFNQEVLQYQEYTGRGTSGGAIIYKDCVAGVNFAGMLEYDMGLAVPVENLKVFLTNYDTYKKLSKQGKLVFLLERLKKKEEEEFNKFIKKAIEEKNKRLDSINKKENKIKEIVDSIQKQNKEK